MDALEIRLSDQITLAVPPRLNSITTYVLLEQETWFEKELAFLRRWIKPGMTAIDIGANLGIYSLALARLVGAQGRVYAYEPGSEARALLQRSREINAAANLEISDRALSDDEREGRLILGGSSELNALGDGEGEAVHVTSLDLESDRRGWTSPDFMKIDAEGEEERILAGGRNFLARHSPLIMFEIKAGDSINKRLLQAFPALGYRLFRLLDGAPILVAFDPDAPLDGFELNLFAAKADRVQSLREDDILVETPLEWEPDDAAIAKGLALLSEQAFAPAFANALKDPRQIDQDYLKGLAAFAAWRDADRPAAARWGAMIHGYRSLAALCQRKPTPARMSTFARVAWEGGWRAPSVAVLENLAQVLAKGPFQLAEPCWPACPRLDRIVPRNIAAWFASAVGEQLERSRSFSTLFSGLSPWLEWLCNQPDALAEMQRRRTLLAARAGARPRVPDRLRNPAPDHLNADLWRSGMVPGTSIGA